MSTPRRFSIQFQSSANTQGAAAMAAATQQVANATNAAAAAAQRNTAATQQQAAAQNAAAAAAARNAAAQQTGGASVTAPGGARPGSAGPRRDMGRAALEVSRAVEDAQYGIGGVLNNIPGLVMMLGGGAGLAGALSLAAVGASQLWKALGNSSEAEDALKKLKETVKEMDGEFKSLGESLRGSLLEDVKAWGKEIEQYLDGAKKAMATAREEIAREAEAAKLEVQGRLAQISLAGAQDEMAGDPHAAWRQGEKARRENQQGERDALAGQPGQIVDNMERTKNSIVAARDTQAVMADELRRVEAERRNILGTLRNAGVESDQARRVREYEEAKAGLPGSYAEAAAAEEEMGKIPYAPRWTGIAPGYWAARDKRDAAMERARQQRETLDVSGPFVEEYRRKIVAGDVTFDQAKEAGMTPEQRSAVEAGGAHLKRLQAEEETARQSIQRSTEQIAEGEKAMAGFVAELKKAREQMRQFELRAAAENLRAAQNVPADLPVPELPSTLPRLPGENAAPVLPPIDFPTMPPPELPTQEIEQALEGVTASVERGFSALAGMSEKTLRATQTSVSQLEARLNQLAGEISAVKGGMS